MTDVEPLLDAAGVAHILNVTRTTVYRMANEGELPHLRVRSEYRFRREDVSAFIKQALRS